MAGMPRIPAPASCADFVIAFLLQVSNVMMAGMKVAQPPFTLNGLESVACGIGLQRTLATAIGT